MKKYSKIAGIIVLVIIAIVCAVKYIPFSNLAENFTKDNPKGELFKVILTGIGGIGFIWGLWLNSRRIKEQNRQNCISENSNSDKRFGDAIGYLGSENISIVLGGIYSLSQLAKEDKRYRSIVANLLCSYLRENSASLYMESDKKLINEIQLDKRNTFVPIQIQTIIDILFNSKESVFENETFDLSHIVLRNVRFSNTLNHCHFNYSQLINCSFNLKLIHCGGHNSEFIECNFGSIFELCSFSETTFKKCHFFTITNDDRVKKISTSLFSFFKSNISSDEDTFVIFFMCDIYNCFFTGFDLIRYNFIKTNFSVTDFNIKNIIRSSFSFGSVEELKFVKSKFTNTMIEENQSITYQDCINKPEPKI